MSILWTGRDNRTVEMYATLEVDARSVTGQYIGTGAPPGSWLNKVLLGFRPKHLIITDPTNTVIFEAAVDSSGAIPSPPGAPVDAINVAGMAYGGMGLILPVETFVQFAPDGFYVDTLTNAALPYNYYATY